MVNPTLSQSLGVCDDRKRREGHMVLGRRCPVIGVSPRLELERCTVPAMIKISTNNGEIVRGNSKVFLRLSTEYVLNKISGSLANLVSSQVRRSLIPKAVRCRRVRGVWPVRSKDKQFS
jgi:hypothetical protein